MATEENKALVRRFHEEVHLGTNAEAAAALMAADYEHRDAALPPELLHGRDAYLQLVGMFHTAFPGFSMGIEDLLADGDKVAMRWRFRGTNQGELQGMPASGKQVDFSGTHIVRIADGKLAEGWVNFDALVMMQQVGAMPAPGQAAT
jgi:steroid delta-isomerase-like uncharacterized protein